MSHNQLLTFLISFHGSVALVVVAAYYKFGDRTDVFVKSLAGNDLILQVLKRIISADLALILQPLFKNSGTEPSPLLTPGQQSYYERPINPIGSELYNETIHDFITKDNEAISDLRNLKKAIDAWCYWTRLLGWSLTILICWQVLMLGIIILEKLANIIIPNCILYITVLPTAIGVVLAIMTIIPIQLYHSRILDNRRKYGSH